jgi:benzylsuccinate CoA-transferase BbsE subunit
MNGALAALAGHHYREKTGKGQHIDVSIQESVLLTSFNLHAFWELQGISLRREGSRSMRGERNFRSCWRCKDGYVSWRLFTGPWAKWTRPLVARMKEEGQDEGLADVAWESLDMNRITQEHIDRFEAVIEAFFLRHTKKALFDWARREKVPLLPVNAAADILEDEQLAARGFWREVPSPEPGLTLKHAGPAFQPDGDPFASRRAPRIGEHNEEIFKGEMGLSKKTLRMLKSAGVV